MKGAQQEPKNEKIFFISFQPILMRLSSTCLRMFPSSERWKKSIFIFHLLSLKNQNSKAQMAFAVAQPHFGLDSRVANVLAHFFYSASINGFNVCIYNI